MKTIRLLMLAFLGLAGYVGAGAAAGKNVQGTLCHLQANGTFVELNLNQRDKPNGWTCDSNSPLTCTCHKIDPNGDTVLANMTKAETGNYIPL